MDSAATVILLFAVCFVVVLAVGFIGNKIVDGAQNAMRSKRIQKQNANHTRYTESESLAERYRSYPVQQAQPSRYCTNCGSPLNRGEQSCPSCGNIVSSRR